MRLLLQLLKLIERIADCGECFGKSPGACWEHQQQLGTFVGNWRKEV